MKKLIALIFIGFSSSGFAQLGIERVQNNPFVGGMYEELGTRKCVNVKVKRVGTQKRRVFMRVNTSCQKDIPEVYELDLKSSTNSNIVFKFNSKDKGGFYLGENIKAEFYLNKGPTRLTLIGTKTNQEITLTRVSNESKTIAICNYKGKKARVVVNNEKFKNITLRSGRVVVGRLYIGKKYIRVTVEKGTWKDPVMALQINSVDGESVSFSNYTNSGEIKGTPVTCSFNGQ